MISIDYLWCSPSTLGNSGDIVSHVNSQRLRTVKKFLQEWCLKHMLIPLSIDIWRVYLTCNVEALWFWKLVLFIALTYVPAMHRECPLYESRLGTFDSNWSAGDNAWPQPFRSSIVQITKHAILTWWSGDFWINSGRRLKTGRMLVDNIHPSFEPGRIHLDLLSWFECEEVCSQSQS